MTDSQAKALMALLVLLATCTDQSELATEERAASAAKVANNIWAAITK